MVEVVIVQCILADNKYQQKFEVSYTFRSNKSFTYMLNGEPSNSVFLKSYTADFHNIFITFIDKNGRLLEIEDWFDNKK